MRRANHGQPKAIPLDSDEFGREECLLRRDPLGVKIDRKFYL